jgi:hypothetical protein
MEGTTMRMMALLRTTTLGAAALLAGAFAAHAQDRYPSRPIQVIVPTPPGGGTDIIARQLAEIVEPTLGQKLVIENKPGGGGTVGTTLITQAKPPFRTPCRFPIRRIRTRRSSRSGSAPTCCARLPTFRRPTARN